MVKSSLLTGSVVSEKNEDLTLRVLREEGITDKRRDHLIGRRRFVTRILSHTKRRIKLFNVVSYNGVSQDLAMQFIRIAANEMPQAQFQRLYGLGQCAVRVMKATSRLYGNSSMATSKT